MPRYPSHNGSLTKMKEIIAKMARGRSPVATKGARRSSRSLVVCLLVGLFLVLYTFRAPRHHHTEVISTDGYRDNISDTLPDRIEHEPSERFYQDNIVPVPVLQGSSGPEFPKSNNMWSHGLGNFSEANSRANGVRSQVVFSVDNTRGGLRKLVVTRWWVPLSGSLSSETIDQVSQDDHGMTDGVIEEFILVVDGTMSLTLPNSNTPMLKVVNEEGVPMETDDRVIKVFAGGSAYIPHVESSTKFSMGAVSESNEGEFDTPEFYYARKPTSGGMTSTGVTSFLSVRWTVTNATKAKTGKFDLVTHPIIAPHAAPFPRTQGKRKAKKIIQFETAVMSRFRAHAHIFPIGKALKAHPDYGHECLLVTLFGNQKLLPEDKILGESVYFSPLRSVHGFESGPCCDAHGGMMHLTLEFEQ